jgi:fatty acid desaturase
MRFLSKVHEKYYDLTDFKHPGGDIALSLAFRRDATELFESMHQFSDKTKLHAILKKYEVVDLKSIAESDMIESSNVYDWKETNTAKFTLELNEIAERVLISGHTRAEGVEQGLTKINLVKIGEITFFFLLTALQYHYFVKGSLFSMVTFPTALWMFTVNVFHDGSHFALSKYPVVNHFFTETALLFSTPFTWYHQHIIGHHCFPNVIGKDPDLYHSTKFTRHSKDIRLKSAHANQPFTFPLLWLVGVPLGLVMRGCFESLAGKPYNKVVKLIPDDASHIISRKSIIPRLIAIAALMFVAPFFYHGLTWKGLAFATIPYLVYSAHFMTCSQINHFTPDCDDQFSNNFYIHQILTGHNVAPGSYLLYLYTGGLNLQIEHHLFPSVNHCHLPRLAPFVRALCAKHNINYNVSPGMVSAVIKYVMHLTKFAKSDSEASQKEQSSFGKSSLDWGSFMRTVTTKWPVSETSSTI